MAETATEMVVNELTQNGLNLVALLKANTDKEVTLELAAQALEVKPNQITPVMNQLAKKGIAIRNEVKTVGEDGKEVIKKLFELTDFGAETDFVLKTAKPRAKKVKEDVEA